MIIKTADRYLIIDESGNLGPSGRYFVIACIETPEYKPLNNVMKRKLGKAKSMFPELAKLHSHEIKANEAYPCVKYHILETIARKNIKISYIVADLKHVKSTLLVDKNIFYNYLMKILITHLISEKDNGTSIQVIYDNHTTKVGSVNSMEDYLKITLLLEQALDITIDFLSMDSDDANAYAVQAADYVANALYGHYEYGDKLYYKKITSIIHKALFFPVQFFGK